MRIAPPLASLAVLVLAAACAPKSTPDPLMAAATATEGRTEPGAITESSVVSTAATIVTIDRPSRRLTLRMPDGRTRAVTVDSSVQNLGRVRPGDEVVATYYESIAIELRKAGSTAPGETDDTAAARSAPGQRPGGAVAETTSITATIVKIDLAHHLVDLREPAGALTTVHVSHPEQLAHVTVGDLVEVSVTEAVAVQVEKARKH